MELQVRLEPLSVLGQPVVIEGWICGTLAPAGAQETQPVEYKNIRVTRRPIPSTRGFLLDHINAVDKATNTGAREARLCATIQRHGVVSYTSAWVMPLELPLRCARWWRRTEGYGCIPFALELKFITGAIERIAAFWDLLRALLSSDAAKIADAQRRQGLIEDIVRDPRSGRWRLTEKTSRAITDQVAPEFGVTSQIQLISQALRYATLGIGRDSKGAPVMTASADDLGTALLLALCDNISVSYQRCKACGIWFSASVGQVHCSPQCRTRAGVYRLRAVRAVMAGADLRETSARYSVPIDELRERVKEGRRERRRASRPRKGASR
jgi:hypothetical protein